MPGQMMWEVADGAQHNFSPASQRHAPGLFVSAAPCTELPGMGAGEMDLGLRMMALTSWLDLVIKCKIKHVICLMEEEEMQRRYRGLGDGDLESTCRSQGLAFHHTPLYEGWPSPSAATDALAALRLARPSAEAAAVVICPDGRRASAGVAAAWLVLECGQEPLEAAGDVAVTAEGLSAARAPLAPFEEQLRGAGSAAESFAAFLSQVSKLAGE